MSWRRRFLKIGMILIAKGRSNGSNRGKSRSKSRLRSWLVKRLSILLDLDFDLECPLLLIGPFSLDLPQATKYST